MTTMKPILLRLEPDQYRRLRWLSFVESRPVSAMVRDAVDAYLKDKQQPKPGQEWFWTEAWQAAERQAETDLAAGEYETFDTMAGFLKDLG